MTRVYNSRSVPLSPRTKKVAHAPRKAPQQARSEATVRTILDATARVLVKVGYDHASTNRVAEAAGVSVGSLYQYFPNKEALVAALIDRHQEEMMAAFAARMERAFALPPQEAVALHVRGMLDAHLVDPVLHKIIAEQIPRVGKLAALMEDINQRAAQPVRQYLAQHRGSLRPGLDLDVATFVVVNLVESLTHRVVLVPGAPDREPLVQAITEVVSRYLLP